MHETEILEKAKALAEAIGSSQVKARADQANQALTGDAAAVDLINGYHDKREEKLAAFGDRQPTAQEAQEVNQYLQEEFNKIAENPVIREYIEANRNLEQVLSQVDQIIQNAISGGHSCGGSCGSCAGCQH